MHKLEKAVVLRDYSEVDQNGCMVINEEKNSNLYKILLEKMSSNVYSSKKNPIISTIEKGIDSFKTLSIDRQVNMLLDVVNNLYGKKQTVDLEKIGGSKYSGMCLCNREISKYSEAKLVFSSTTGIYAKIVDLLKI